MRPAATSVPTLKGPYCGGIYHVGRELGHERVPRLRMPISECLQFLPPNKSPDDSNYRACPGYTPA